MAQQLPLADQTAVVKSLEGLLYECTHEDLVLALITAAPRLSQAHRKLLHTALNRLNLLDSPLLKQNRLSARQGGGSVDPHQVLQALVEPAAGRNTLGTSRRTSAGPIAHNTSEGCS